MFAGSLANLSNSDLSGIMRLAMWLGIPLVVIGVLFLMWDLGQPSRFMNTLLKPNSSWISRGSWILTCLLILTFALFGLWIWPFNLLSNVPVAVTALEVLIAIFAFGTMLYTGPLLAASKPIPFWNTSMLPALFAVSAIVAGLEGIDLLLTLNGLLQVNLPPQTLAIIGHYVAILIPVEMVLVVLYLWGASQTPTGRFSSKTVLFGGLAAQFWVGYVVLGLLVPLLAVTFRFGFVAGQTIPSITLGSALGLLGSFLLRLIIVSAGAKRPIMTFGGLIVLPGDM